jgi:pilus assembly protein CpaE
MWQAAPLVGEESEGTDEMKRAPVVGGSRGQEATGRRPIVGSTGGTGRPEPPASPGGSGGDLALMPLPQPRVAIAIQGPGLHQEVLDHLDRQPRISVVSSLANADQLVAWRQGPRGRAVDVLVACPIVARALARGGFSGVRVLVVAQEMTVPVLRTAIQAGAHGVFCWPEERLDLAHAIHAAMSSAPPGASARGRVIALFAARGGVGVTFLASHLAAAFAKRGERTVLIDVDPAYGDLTASLGFIEDDQVRTIRDLAPVVEELSPQHVQQVVTHHPGGFDVLLSVPPAFMDRPAGSVAGRAGTEPVPTGLFGACAALLAADYQRVVLHLPRVLGGVAEVAMRLADVALVVTGQDLMALYGSRRTIDALRRSAITAEVRVVLNSTRRGEVSAAEVERVLGTRPVARIGPNRAAASAQAMGMLLGHRSRRTWRELESLASSLDAGPATGEAS